MSWFAEEQTSRFSPVLHSQAQPDPNLVAAAVEKALLNSLKLPKLESIAIAISPFGFPPPFGERIFQKREWL